MAFLPADYGCDGSDEEIDGYFIGGNTRPREVSILNISCFISTNFL